MKIHQPMFIGCAALTLVACRSPQTVAPTPPTQPTQAERPATGEQPVEPEEPEQQPPIERVETATEAEDEKLGEVAFETSCNAQAQQHFEVGLARLHHMWYEKARESFDEAASADSQCAMAHWGVAMTYYTPLWAKPEPQDLEAGARAAQRAGELEAPTQRERDFIAAVTAFYDDWEARDHTARAEAYRDGWKRAYERDQNDNEAAAFYALGILATVPPAAENYERQEQAGAILEQVLQREPLHPGGHHYLIHAYDHPPLAERAVPVARSYGEIAPSVPHALHMPSHIFTRLGMWEEVVDWNERSAEAAAQNPVGDMTSMHFYHALDYVAYAHLQQAQDRQADDVVRRVRAADNPHPHMGTAYASVAIPARIALERKDWETAIRLEPLHSEQLAWEKWPYLQAVVHATRAIGAVKLGQLDMAKSEIARLEELHTLSSQLDEPYWTAQAQVFHDIARGLVAQAEERPDEAVTIMREAMTLQNSMDKHPVSPGHIVVASDYLGTALLENDQPEQALTVFEQSLERAPNRFRALYGAGKAAQQAGQEDVARDHYTRLLEVASESDGRRPELDEARQFVENVQERAQNSADATGRADED